MAEQSSGVAPRTVIESLVALLGLVLGAAVGIKFADIDQYVPNILLHHRALLTHGLLASLFLGWMCLRTRHQELHQALRGLTIGFSMTNAVHLSFDLFPRGWWGYALIHIFVWALPPVLSWLWIASSIVVCIYIARFFVRTIWDMLIPAAGMIMGVTAHAHEGLIFPLIALFLGGIVAFLIPFPFRGESFSRK